jgi:hypothetical protein
MLWAQITVDVYFMARLPLVRQDLLIDEVSRSYSDTPKSEGILWKKDQPLAETSTSQRTRKKSMHSEGVEPAIQASDRLC